MLASDEVLLLKSCWLKICFRPHWPANLKYIVNKWCGQKLVLLSLSIEFVITLHPNGGNAEEEPSYQSEKPFSTQCDRNSSKIFCFDKWCIFEDMQSWAEILQNVFKIKIQIPTLQSISNSILKYFVQIYLKYFENAFPTKNYKRTTFNRVPYF